MSIGKFIENFTRSFESETVKLPSFSMHIYIILVGLRFEHSFNPKIFAHFILNLFILHLYIPCLFECVYVLCVYVSVYICAHAFPSTFFHQFKYNWFHTSAIHTHTQRHTYTLIWTKRKKIKETHKNVRRRCWNERQLWWFEWKIFGCLFFSF